MDFFVSYTKTDRPWAEWVAWQLEDVGYRVLVQDWDFVPGSNWTARMQQGIVEAERTIALLSHAYLRSVYGQPEWQAAWAADPDGFSRKLIPVRVEDCPRPGLLGQIVSIDVFGYPDEEAQQHLLTSIAAACAGRAKPETAPALPSPHAPGTAAAHPEHPFPVTALVPDVAPATASAPPTRHRRHRLRSGGSTLEEMADFLADGVRAQWDREFSRRDINQPPLTVSWEPADPALVQPWPYLESVAEAGGGWSASAHPATGPHELAGRGGELVDVLDRVPTGRLVILGEPGSGKTTLLARLVIDLIDRRSRMSGDPVPLLLPLASWDPDLHKDLHDWLEDRIVRDYRWLRLKAPATSGVSWARALVDAGMILPILDGLDEVRSSRRDAAIAAINETLPAGRRLVLSCRAEEYAQAVRPNPDLLIYLEAAAGVRLRRLEPSQVADYLTASGGSAPTVRWGPVLATLADTPAAPVAVALSTPLMASLVRTIYTPRRAESPRRVLDPAELCDTDRFPTRDAVEKHLFDGFIPAAYRPVGAHREPWTAEQAEQYLTFLARHLEDRLRTTSLAWWEIPRAMPRSVVIGAFTLMIGIFYWIGLGVLGGMLTAFDPESSYGFLPGFAAGLVAGLVFGIIDVVVVAPAVGMAIAAPREVVVRSPRLRDLVGGVTFGLIYGLKKWLKYFIFVFLATAGPLILIAYMIDELLPVSPTVKVVTVFLLALPGFITIIVGLIRGINGGVFRGLKLDTPARIDAIANPSAILAEDHACAWVGGLTFALTYLIMFGSLGWLPWLLGRAVGEEGLPAVHTKLLAVTMVGVLLGLVAGLTYALGSSWGRFCLARLWLAWRRRLPLRLMTFLNHAHERGVLRQAGSVWEFRHAHLQRYLASRS